MRHDNSGWIECRRKLPDEDGMLVVVFDPLKQPTVCPAKWDAENVTFDTGGSFDGAAVTHWMPLPVAPKSPWWIDGFMACDAEEKAGWPEDYTHNPHQPTSPYTYPDYHCGPPSYPATEWDAGYHFRQFIHHHGTIRLKITHKIGNQNIEMYL